jgi:hypothetical protein
MYGTKKTKKEQPKQPGLKVKIKASGNAATRLLNRLGYQGPNATG